MKGWSRWGRHSAVIRHCNRASVGCTVGGITYLTGLLCWPERSLQYNVLQQEADGWSCGITLKSGIFVSGDFTAFAAARQPASFGPTPLAHAFVPAPRGGPSKWNAAVAGALAGVLAKVPFFAMQMSTDCSTRQAPVIVHPMLHIGLYWLYCKSR